MENNLEIRDIRVSRDGREVVGGVSLTVPAGGLVALLGPNGSGKTSLVSAVMGHPNYRIEGGDVLIGGESLLALGVDERARRGLFLSLQHPPEVPGVTVGSFLRAAWAAVSAETVGMADFRGRLVEELEAVRLGPEFLGRGLNEGFSGGEKKRAEVLQMAALTPEIAVMDETDSGLDIDALRIVSEGVNTLRGPGLGVLVITHYQRILNYIKPDFVHIMLGGRIVETGGADLALHLEEHGYDWLREKNESVLA